MTSLTNPGVRHPTTNSKVCPRVARDTKLLTVVTAVLANGRGRWLAIAASVIVSSAMVYAQSTEHRCCVGHPAVAKTAAPGSPQIARAPDGPQMSAPADGPRIATPAEVQSLAANAPTAPAAAQNFLVALPPGVAPEHGLQVKTIWAARAIGVLFPEIRAIGGYRQDALKWHPEGLAIDVMIPNYHSPEGIALGNQIAGYALANAKRWGINHVIWRQRIYPGIGTGSWTADYGNETLNHYDHVHIATNGGGYPTGHEIYYIAAMSPQPPA